MMNIRLGAPKLGFDEGEQREFNRALKQQLLVQTPLQVLLETLYTRLQSQAQLFTELQKRVDKLESKDLDSQELLHRVQLCEGKLNDITVSKLSPFNQHEILARLEELEADRDCLHVPLQLQGEPSHASAHPPLAAEPSTRTQLREQQAAGMEARLAAVEGKVRGVYNLAGKLIALEHIAGNLGVQVPDLEYNPGMPTDGLHTPRTNEGFSCSPRLPVPSLPLPLGKSSPRTSEPIPEVSDRSQGAGPSAARVSELSSEVQLIAAETAALKAAMEALHGGLSQVQADFVQTQSDTSQRMDQLEADARQSAARQAEEMAAIRTLARREHEVSFADFSRLQSHVEAACREVHTATDAVDAIRDQDLKSLRDAIAELQVVCRKVDAPRDVDTLFHHRISAMEEKLEDIKAEAQGAVMEAMEGVAKASDVRQLGQALESKASQQDIKLLAQQQAALAHSVNGMAEWLAVRPETSDGVKGTGACLTKFKCLTCDREMKTQSAPNGNPTTKGSFLPRLDGMHGQNPVPIGPGLNRQAKSPVRGQEVGESGMPEEGLHVTSPRSMRAPASARAPMQLAPGGLKMHKSQTPVFC